MQALAYYIDLKENFRNISQARQMVSVGSAPITIFIIIKTSLLFELKNFFTVSSTNQYNVAGQIFCRVLLFYLMSDR